MNHTELCKSQEYVCTVCTNICQQNFEQLATKLCLARVKLHVA